ncbi:MAG: hypothetical protein VYC33_04880 [Candidatus Thermoplasmatota archaeon]|nr:hypothetical protein [Candidatus Thermoplasmatota archaeon]
MEEEQNSGTLEGTTEPTVVDAGRVFVNTGPNYPVQKNQAAKVIGILVIIFGAVNLLLSPLTLLSDFGATDLAGNPISYPTEYFVVAILSSIIVGVISIFAGYQITQYQKKGIWLMFGAFAIAWISSVVISIIQGNAMDSGPNYGPDFGAVMGIGSGICYLFCYAICGIIVAIPLMLTDGGME